MPEQMKIFHQIVEFLLLNQPDFGAQLRGITLTTLVQSEEPEFPRANFSSIVFHHHDKKQMSKEWELFSSQR